jgi:prepilin-type N-terminal cleavage/methylation domain-containing protein
MCLNSQRARNVSEKMLPRHDNSGFTLLELLISMVILSIIMIGLHQAMATALSTHQQTTNRQELLAQARYAMERMVMFAQETDHIEIPAADTLVLNERVLDTYDNETHGYKFEGDGFLDADNDYDGVVNEGGVNEDPVDPISFSLDKSEPNNWKLQEQMPDYGSPTLDDFLATKVLCEHVTTFSCELLAPNLVEIQLTVNNGEHEVNLKTRVKSMYME